MKFIVTLTIVAVVSVFTSCSSEPNVEERLSEKLKGTWIFRAVALSDKKAKRLESISANEVVGYNQMLNILQFDGNETVLIDTGGIKPLKGKYIVDDTIINIKLESPDMPRFTFGSKEVTDTSRLRFFSIVAAAETGNDKRYLWELRKVYNLNLAQTDWSKPLPANASEADVKQKVKTILKYYAEYCSVLDGANSSIFYPQRFNLPFESYSNGVAMLTIDKWDPEFKAIINNDAQLPFIEKMFKDIFGTINVEGDYNDETAGYYRKIFLALEREIK